MDSSEQQHDPNEVMSCTQAYLQPRPHIEVVIVGGGLAGLLLGILLHKAGTPFTILERASSIKPLGAVMALGVNILPILQQLDLLEELQRISKPILTTNMYREDMKKLGVFEVKESTEINGFDTVVFPRPEFYDILLSRIPSDKIVFGKKVSEIKELTRDNKVEVTCTDGSKYLGDILVGADGAYSSVRQCLYKELEIEGVLPSSDKRDLKCGFVTMVGTTDPLDPEKYPALKDEYSFFSQVIGTDKPYSWSTFTVPNNRACWNIQLQLDSAKSKAELAQTEWGVNNNEDMIKEVDDFRTPLGATMGELIRATPQDRVSRIFLEEKLYDTWYHGRVVLIGDACHKLLPSAGQGAVNAMQDAAILANCLYDLESRRRKDITAAFQDYKEQRYKHVKHHFDASVIQGRILFGQTMVDKAIRYAALNWASDSMQKKNVEKTSAYRPLVTYLPSPPKRGTAEILPQKPSTRYQAELDVRAAGGVVVE
ncbi:hypothetical protein BGZ96_008609 [Linnemannia gamsii]|uniref:FAD-binding domain-containing protein n=1 Tax=Linnemannia gamsii TaxID=64522 RepID=A0ABQ7KFG7_9FUNG|nr:hypothetical protein BGZ96_008609 [Linnemannia gamsii]